MEVIIDRFEGNYAVVELAGKKFVNIPKELVPEAKEGDVIKILVDHEQTKNREKRVKKWMDQLFLD